jgi:hypothetical protein
MRLFFIITTILFSIYGCKTNDETSNLTTLKDYQLRGSVIYLPKKTNKGLESTKELYFRVENKNYFIKLSESSVSALYLMKYIDKPVVVKGSIKEGLWENQKPMAINSVEQPEKARSGPYIVIEKIYKNKK